MTAEEDMSGEPQGPFVPPAWEPVDPRGPKITRVRTICTAPDGVRLVIVKVETSEYGLYGLGCATFTQRPLAVVTAVEEYLKPLLSGRDVSDIEDIWQAVQLSSYWRNGPVLNNALSGVDQALWDIKAKRAGLPLHDLLGGRCRAAAAAYVHANGRDAQEVGDAVERYMDQGFRHVRCQVEVPGYATYGVGKGDAKSRAASASYRLVLNQARWEPREYCALVPALFDQLRNRFGERVELLHDVHERVPPPMAIQLAKDLEPYRLFFLEDLFAPEDQEYLARVRLQCSVPLAIGELHAGPSEYMPVVVRRLTDFVRSHISTIGGLTPARKLAVLAEFFGIRTAWHGPADVSPVGHAANLHLDLCVPNFGVQEVYQFSDAMRETFPGCPEIKDGSIWPNGLPGLGVDIDEGRAARYPFPEHELNGSWPEIRRADGTIVRP